MLDFHTHNQEASGDAIINLPQEAMFRPEAFELRDGVKYSAGIHPWFQDQSEVQLQSLLYWLKRDQVVAVGECGLDKLCDNDYNLQFRLFRQQLELAIAHRKMVIIHCVKSFDHLISIVKPLLEGKSPLLSKAVVHGFRGKPELAERLLRVGLSFSFGEYFNAETVRMCPIDRLYIETDDSKLSIEKIGSKVNAVR